MSRWAININYLLMSIGSLRRNNRVKEGGIVVCVEMWKGGLGVVRGVGCVCVCGI